jgi:hypothetical protein
MKKLKKLLEVIDFDQSGPVKSSEVKRYEEILGLKFGPGFKLYLSEYGCIASGANELYGICGNNASIPSAIHATKSARRDPNFPKDLVVIADDGSGRKMCVDKSDRIHIFDRNTCRDSGQSFEDFAVEWLGS